MKRPASGIAILAGAVVALAGVGCGANDEEMPAPVAMAVKFEGKPDAAIAGTYQTSDKRSTYTFDPSGSFEMKGKVSMQGQSFNNDVKGAWSIAGNRFLFKYGDGNVVPYAFVKDGNKLILTLTGSMKRETVLIKQ